MIMPRLNRGVSGGRKQKIGPTNTPEQKAILQKKAKEFFKKNTSENSRNAIKQKVKGFDGKEIRSLIVEAKKTKDPAKFLLAIGIDARQLKAKGIGLRATASIFGLKETASIFGLKETASVFGLRKIASVFSLKETASVFGLKETVNAFGGLSEIARAFGLSEIAKVFGVKGLQSLGLSTYKINEIMSEIKKKK